jgi:hypothetical protein
VGAPTPDPTAIRGFSVQLSTTGDRPGAHAACRGQTPQARGPPLSGQVRDCPPLADLALPDRYPKGRDSSAISDRPGTVGVERSCTGWPPR